MFYDERNSNGALFHYTIDYWHSEENIHKKCNLFASLALVVTSPFFLGVNCIFINIIQAKRLVTITKISII